MEHKQYKTPTVKIVEIRVERLLGVESMGMDSTNKVTSDESVFSRSAQGSWDDYVE